MESSQFYHPPWLEILEGVGRGAYASVYRAVRTTTNPETGEPIREVVAVKRLRRYKAAQVANEHWRVRALRRVCRELAIIMYFRDVPQIIGVHEIYLSPDEEELYIVMPYVSHTLKDVAAAGVVLSEECIRWIVLQILLGLDAMHQCNCIHRDITLTNVLVDAEDTWDCFIADFGLSRSVEDTEKDISLDVVTLPYRAPEILLQNAKYNSAIDIWSAGCVAMELFLSRPFLQGKDAIEQINLIIGKLCGFPDVTSLRGLVSDSAAAYLERLAADPSNQPLPSAVPLQTLLPPGTSSDAAEVLTAMLRFDPRERATARQLLQMKWFMSDSACVEAIEKNLRLNIGAPSIPEEAAIEQASTIQQLLAFINEKTGGLRGDRVTPVQLII